MYVLLHVQDRQQYLRSAVWGLLVVAHHLYTIRPPVAYTLPTVCVGFDIHTEPTSMYEGSGLRAAAGGVIFRYHLLARRLHLAYDLLPVQH